MIDRVKPLYERKTVFLPVCSSFCMLSLNIAFLCREQEECHNDVFLSEWFGLALCLSVPCCQWKYKGQSSWNCNWNTFKCSVVCWVVTSPCLLVAHSLPIRGARVRVIVNSHTKSNNQQCTAASLMECNTRESANIILLYVWAAQRDMWAGKGLHVWHHFPRLQCAQSRVCRESVLQLIA